MTSDSLVAAYRAALDPTADSSPLITWQKLTALAQQPLTDTESPRDTDALLFEATATRTFQRKPGYQISITREVCIEDGDPIYVTCSFAYDIQDPLLPDEQLWGSPGAPAAEWIEAVERTPAFALLNQPPLAHTIDASRP
ncbi:MAG: hypothetical protein JWQ18_797 [Conexibacter sp.]|nr:hypothetical protein [Conexibacter sp.]